MKLSRCDSCNAEIIWAVSNATGSRIPIDINPVLVIGEPEKYPARGLFVLVKRLDDVPLAWSIEVPDAGALHTFKQRKAALYRTHFASCPNAAKHRRPVAKAA